MGRTIQPSSVSGKTEGDFRAELVKKLRATVHEGVRPLVVPVETGTTMLGVGDVFLRTRKVSVWMELKRLRYEPLHEWEVDYRTGQRQFLQRFYLLGGRSVLAVATPSEVLYFKDKDILEGYSPPYDGLNVLRQKKISAKELLVWLER